MPTTYRYKQFRYLHNALKRTKHNKYVLISEPLFDELMQFDKDMMMYLITLGTRIGIPKPYLAIIFTLMSNNCVDYNTIVNSVQKVSKIGNIHINNYLWELRDLGIINVVNGVVSVGARFLNKEVMAPRQLIKQN